MDAGAGEPNRVQAQVFIQAPADMGQAAQALRTLADELEQFAAGGGGGGHGAGRGARVAQPLGHHWPQPLVLPVEPEVIAAELGCDVPRGFVCPITQEVMRQPAPVPYTPRTRTTN